MLPLPAVRLCPSLVLWLSSSFIVVFGCERGPEKPSAPAPALPFGFAGCREITAERRCVFEPGESIRLFFPDTHADSLALQDAQHLTLVEKTEVPGGARLTVRVGQGARHALVASKGRVARLALGARTPDPVLDRARKLRQDGDLAGAKELLGPLLTDPSPARRAQASSLAARIRLAERDIEGALAQLEQARTLAESAGLRRQAALNSLTIADTLSRHRWDLASMRAALDRIAPDLVEDHLDATRQRAVAALMTGDLRSALALSQTCLEQAEQYHLPSFKLWTAQLRLQVLGELGRLAEGRALAESLRASAESDPCEQARLASNAGWLELVASGDTERAYAESMRAVALYRSACPGRWDLQNALVNVALSELRRERWEQAGALLREATTLGEPAGWVAAWHADIEANLLLKKGDARAAEARYRELLQRTAVGAPIASRFRARVGLARALRARGKLREAADELARAEALLDEELLLIPLGEGRESFVGNRLDSARELVDVLLLLGEPAPALEVARQARARPLRLLALRDRIEALDAAARATWDRHVSSYLRGQSELTALQQGAWRVPIAELPALAEKSAQLARTTRAAMDAAYTVVRDDGSPLPASPPGTLSLHYFPLPEGWVLFARLDGELRAVRLRSTSDTGVPSPDTLLTDVSDLVERASTVRVVSYGALGDVDFHALPFASGMLSDRAIVVYGMDVHGRAREARPLERALVVINPRGDLPGASQEGAVIKSLFARAGAQATWLEQAAASHERVSAALGTVDLFHFGGHGKAEGLLGLQSRLWLAGHDVLETAEVLALERVPQVVVLSACESARGATQSDANLGVAQAFILRGTRVVLAATRAIPDHTGVTLAKVLYADGIANVTPVGMHSSLRALRERFGEGGAFASYRIYTP
jgi:hypothetical protein